MPNRGGGPDPVALGTGRGLGPGPLGCGAPTPAWLCVGIGAKAFRRGSSRDRAQIQTSARPDPQAPRQLNIICQGRKCASTTPEIRGVWRTTEGSGC